MYEWDTTSSSNVNDEVKPYGSIVFSNQLYRRYDYFMIGQGLQNGYKNDSYKVISNPFNLSITEYPNVNDEQLSYLNNITDHLPTYIDININDIDDNFTTQGDSNSDTFTLSNDQLDEIITSKIEDDGTYIYVNKEVSGAKFDGYTLILNNDLSTSVDRYISNIYINSLDPIYEIKPFIIRSGVKIYFGTPGDSDTNNRNCMCVGGQAIYFE